MEERLCNQRDVIKKICAWLTVAKDNLCHCGKENKEPISPELGSPIVLGGPLESSSEESFHSSSALGTTTAMSSESSLPLSSNDDLVIYDSNQSRLIKIEEDPKENITPIPVPAPVLDVDTLRERFAVCRQRAVHSAHWGQRGSYLAGTLRVF